MIKQMNVYLLSCETSDPRFRGFVFAEEANSLMNLGGPDCDFGPERAEYLSWKPRSIKKIWKPQPVWGDVSPFNDYPILELSIPVFSKRAVDALGTMLTDNGELLRLDAKNGEFYALNLLTKLDLLDVAKSDIDSLGPKKNALWINYFWFKSRLVKQATIFRIPQQPNLYLVTDLFKNRVEQAALNGFRFVKVWPLEAGSDWKKIESDQHRSSKKRSLLGQALILRFRFDNKSPSTREKKLVNQIEDSIRQLLKVESMDERYWGTPEICETQDGEFRVFCSCPSCDELAVHLEEWCQSIEWENDFDIVKRYGNLYDKKAKEKRISIRKAKR